MLQERPILSYRKPARRSGLTDAMRLISAVVCVITTLFGILFCGFGALTLWHAFVDYQMHDRGYFILAGGLLGAIGVIAAGFSVRWLINAARPKRSAVLEDDSKTSG